MTGPACRQRAGRERLAAEPDRADLLTPLDRAGRALAAARHAGLSGDVPAAALMELAIAELANAGHTSDDAAVPSATVERPPTPVCRCLGMSRKPSRILKR